MCADFLFSTTCPFLKTPLRKMLDQGESDFNLTLWPNLNGSYLFQISIVFYRTSTRFIYFYRYFFLNRTLWKICKQEFDLFSWFRFSEKATKFEKNIPLVLTLLDKVHIFWEDHRIIWLAVLRTNNWWRFRQILWSSQNIWTLKPLCRQNRWDIFSNFWPSHNVLTL